jgi:predicted MFS family arabinose efflux permease
LLFGVAFGIGMFAGNIAGGFLAVRLSSRSLESPLMIGAVASVLIVPIYIFALFTSSGTWAVLAVGVAAVIGASANPPATAALQNFVSPKSRGVAASLSMISVAVFGIGIGPVVVGMLSDRLSYSFGADGLRLALILIQTINLVAALFYFLAASFWRRQRLRAAVGQDRAAMAQ